MVKPGAKTAAGFIGAYIIAQILRERGMIEDDPLVVYTYSAMIRDVMMLVPQAWETATEETVYRVICAIKRFLDRLCGRDLQLPR